MKSIFFLFQILLLASCNNNHKHSTSTDTENTTARIETSKEESHNTGSEENTLDKSFDDPIIFVGVFAQWKYTDNEIYDGSYDSTNNLFVLCSANESKQVPREKIIFLPFGKCDTALSDRIMLFQKKPNGEINPTGTSLEIIDNKGRIHLKERTIPINIDAEALDKINKVKVYEMNQKGLNKEIDMMKTKPVDTAKTINGVTIKKNEIYHKKNE